MIPASRWMAESQQFCAGASAEG